MSAETEIRAALAAIKKADGQRELIQAQFELARVCSDDNITALLAKIDALQRDADRLNWLADKNNLVGNVQLPTSCVYQNLHSLRDAIDAAIAESTQGGAT